MSVATLTAIFLFAFLIFFGVTIWIDGKKTYILAPKFNHANGDKDTSGENATAEHQESTETGEMVAKASIDGSGTASASAELGYEYEHADESDINLIVELKFSYQLNLEADNSNSQVKAKVETYLNSDSVTISEESLPKSDTETKTQSRKLIKKSQRHTISLKSGEKFTAYLKLTADVEGADSGKSGCEIVATLEEIYHRPEIKVS